MPRATRPFPFGIRCFGRADVTILRTVPHAVSITREVKAHAGCSVARCSSVGRTGALSIVERIHGAVDYLPGKARPAPLPGSACGRKHTSSRMSGSRDDGATNLSMPSSPGSGRPVRRGVRAENGRPGPAFRCSGHRRWTDMDVADLPRPVGYVLGGGAVQVGMLQALGERKIVPGIVAGSPVGSLNGAVVAADPKGA